MTGTLKSTSCSGLPVDQSNSLRTGSSRQDAHMPLPAAHRKRTCCSPRSETVNVCCEVRKTNHGGFQGRVTHEERRRNIWEGLCWVYFGGFAVQVDHVDFVPVSHPEAAAFGQAAADRLHGEGSQRHHVVRLQVPASCQSQKEKKRLK